MQVAIALAYAYLFSRIFTLSTTVRSLDAHNHLLAFEGIGVYKTKSSCLQFSQHRVRQSRQDRSHHRDQEAPSRCGRALEMLLQ